MVTDFERLRFEVSGRTVTITVWYDERTQAWSSSAPAYSHLFSRAAPASNRSRQAAIDAVRSVLNAHFAPKV